jgi:hypothetical protein
MATLFENTGITKTQEYGGVGESATETVLKSFAQVFRPVPLLEYSIDYFCRLIHKGKPLTPFWVEVKSSKCITDIWKKSIGRETVIFWLNQLAPVFIVIYDVSKDICYWISVEDNREVWSKKLENNAKTITLKVDKSQTLMKANCSNSDFIRKIEKDTISINVANGIPEVISKGGKGMTSGYAFFDFPNIELSERAKNNFQQKIRFSLNFLFRDAYSRKAWSKAYELGKILTIFDKSHYDHFELLGDICGLLGNRNEALIYYDIAIDMFRRDPNWDKNRVEGILSTSENIHRIEQKKSAIT